MGRWKLGLAFALAVLLLTLGPAVYAQAMGPDEAKQAVFRVIVRDAAGEPVSYGTAFGVGEAPLTYLLTSYHVVSKNENGVSIWLSKEQEAACTVAVKLPESDVAVLTLSTPLSDRTPLPLGAETAVRAGDDIYALGFPTADVSDGLTAYAEDVSISKGVVSKKTRWNGVRYYQMDAAINAGNSGGPLLHKNGYVIGINALKIDYMEGIYGAVMIEEALDALDQLQVNYTLFTVADTPTPEPTQQATAQPTQSATLAPSPTPMLAASGGGTGVWLVVFLAAALLFAAAMGYLLILKKRGGGRKASFHFPLAKQGKGYVTGCSGAYRGAVVALEGETLFFGRDPEQCQLVFDAQEKKISRVHCSLRYDEEEQCFLLENYSRNGTFLEDGRPIEDGQSQRLYSGDKFYLVDEGCMFSVSEKNKRPLLGRHDEDEE